MNLKNLKDKFGQLNLKKKKFKVNGKNINIVRSESDLKEKWVYIEFLGPKGELYKLGIGTEKGTNKDIIIVTTLDKDLINQKVIWVSNRFKKYYLSNPISLLLTSITFETNC